MGKKIVFGFALASLFLMGAGCQSVEPAVNQNSSAEETSVEVSDVNSEVTEENTFEMAFFYQYVGGFKNGVGENGVRVGTTNDGVLINSSGKDSISWTLGSEATRTYGDPVFSYLQNGTWAMTSWSGPNDPDGSANLLYQESVCPFVDESKVVSISSKFDEGCRKTPGLVMGKTSQVFPATGGNYMFHMVMGDVYLAHLSDSDSSALELGTMCVLDKPVSSLAELGVGDSTVVLEKSQTDGLLLSDTAVGHRSDGAWVLFVKGSPASSTCERPSLCELCSRSIYRTTSYDLIHWSELEEVVQQASIPEATTTEDGEVWLYWQDFSEACAANDQLLANRAPISTAYEQAGSFELSVPQRISIDGESFQTNTSVHYATNGNPVTLPDQTAYDSLVACLR
ncbi:MAG: hypothetical protein COW24_05290 [Candidatus Kerfeldbacteria bacterium CG15_BIG_FIL_POST_REV_8_21_14_020_45_12]|uniref:Lipoprotein n=1 Tax=Candidatus Kerfeldbacteria bacterium CG15_BIG_FIL_POST_REV_8_21_14_020_45_12 TaxID=2014247 RepID=A0A2M7H2I8_9BACT|nr:MAG: hypothetical protein COW24_05290 [Candidatus Kerfeldbacteria bacterium CG15_BIG_FIL_POST_REV_8_21_14_020_45_12]PJA93478.1 MAG: hypothetical protein CO132_02505 [Candidatus Kerfeldbacteria bacterium CG_4_9_14_3_um_filter_45_8]